MTQTTSNDAMARRHRANELLEEIEQMETDPLSCSDIDQIERLQEGRAVSAGHLAWLERTYQKLTRAARQRDQGEW